MRHLTFGKKYAHKIIWTKNKFKMACLTLNYGANFAELSVTARDLSSEGMNERQGTYFDSVEIETGLFFELVL